MLVLIYNEVCAQSGKGSEWQGLAQKSVSKTGDTIRYWPLLTILDTPREHRSYLTYDLEWIPGELTVRLVGVYDGDRYRCYTSVERFLAGELTDKNRGKWFYAHAGGLADVQFVLDAIVLINDVWPDTYQVDASFSGSSAIIVKVRRGHNVWVFVDSYWLLRDKLANIGDAIGIKKGGYELDPDEQGISEQEHNRRVTARREWYRSVDIRELRDYNEVDCVILYRAIAEFQNAVLDMGGELCFTLASCSMNLFRRRYLKSSCDTNGAVNESARKAYVASRVEVITDRITNGRYYDINSSFPFAMTMPCPGEYLGARKTLPGTGIYIAEVDVTVPECYLPPLPYRVQGRIFFPFGRWRGWLTSVDVRLLEREGGRVNKVYECLVFEERTELADYAKDLYARRKVATSDFQKIVYKLLLNSLYGKFAESADKQRLLISPKTIRRCPGDGCSHDGCMRMLFPGAWIQTRSVPVAHMHVPIAAHITALARRTLYNLMSNCGDNYYCDTDGFATTDNLSTSPELGGLKMEKRRLSAHYVTQKVYKMEGEELQKDGTWKHVTTVKAKGFSRMSVGRFTTLLEGGQIEFERMARVREVFRKGGSTPTENKYLKRMQMRSVFADDFDPKKHAIAKRFAYPDGSTRPWHLSELTDILER